MRLNSFATQNCAQLVLTLALALVPCFVNALSFDRPKPWILNLSGPIEKGDSERLISELLNSRGQKNLTGEVSTITLSSPGGDVLEAARLSQILTIWFVRTEVPAGAECASSCFLLYLSGFKRDAEASQPQNHPVVFGTIAIHRPVIATSRQGVEHLQSNATEQSTGMLALRHHLTAKHVPSYIVDIMMQHGSNEAYRLTDRDLWNVGRYKPEIEEALIRDCGYERRIDEALYTPTAETLTIDQLQAFDEHSEKVAACLQQRIEKPYVEIERPKLRKRLKSGWRPWKSN